MTWKGLNPSVELVSKIYHSGVKLTQEAMNKIEKQIERLSGLENGWWIVTLLTMGGIRNNFQLP